MQAAGKRSSDGLWALGPCTSPGLSFHCRSAQPLSLQHLHRSFESDLLPRRGVRGPPWPTHETRSSKILSLRKGDYSCWLHSSSEHCNQMCSQDVKQLYSFNLPAASALNLDPPIQRGRTFRAFRLSTTRQLTGTCTATCCLPQLSGPCVSPLLPDTCVA